ncbi:ABC transporter permease [Rhodococcus antarcticus]|uniref:ABC transporter permease n=1 Tax=Rhodococcus antarcticus TaxID=2987751 RepID=A0ABY6NY41_9NOCA|nr:ABC transporter permease [Rhodococcus antarcticus]UZJ24315.1 ABC transporter permease [Rhodococcus antarcticus]
MNFFDYLSNNYENLFTLSLEHIKLVVVSMLIATAVGVPLGVLAHRSTALRPPIVSTVSVFLTIPSLALLAVFVPIFGLGSPPAIAGLTLYALLPVVSNTIAGLGSVDPSIVKASRGMGVGSLRRLVQVELPLAWPVIITGIRVATQIVIGIAAIAVLVGGPGLGNEIFRGIRSLGATGADNLVIGGTLAVVVLALLFDAVFVIVTRLTTSRGLR